MANKNDDFNFEEFAVNMIQHIDSLRSILTFGDEKEIQQGSDAKPKESRINAFYRALGLPAVLPPKIKKGDEKKTAKDLAENFHGGTRPKKYNNGNVHEIEFTDDLKQKLDNRQLLSQKKPTETEQKEFLISNKYNFNSSIVSEDSETTNARIRGLLFPMVVDGRIHVYPQNKRIAGAFMSNRERISKADKRELYHQPMIETILYLRLKGENVVNTVKQDSISKSFNTEAIQPLVNYDLESLKALNEHSVKKINKTLNNFGKVFKDNLRMYRKVRKNTGIEIIPKANTIAQENPQTRLVAGKQRSLDRQLARQEDKQAVEDAVLMSVEYEEIDKRNIKGGALAGAFLEILTPMKKTVSQKENMRTKKIHDKQKRDLKKAFRGLELLLGTFSGISGTDIIAVMIAMYRIKKIEILIALLNKDAQERLALIKGTDLEVLKSGQNISVKDALKALESEVKDVFAIIIESTKNEKYDSDPKYQEQEEE